MRNLVDTRRVLLPVLAIVVMSACNRDPQWRQVESGTGLFTFQFPDGWKVEPNDGATILNYRNPKTDGEFTVSGHFGIEDGQKLADITWNAVAGDTPPGPWKRKDGIGWHSWRQRFVSGENGTEVLVIWGNERSVVVTLRDTLDELEDNEEVYEHMLGSVRLDPYAKPPARASSK
jgi:hypothetical protein